MPQPKKRPSKKAKAAQKILENSKLLANAKTQNDVKTGEVFNASDSQIKTNTTANKNRPDKKRG